MSAAESIPVKLTFRFEVGFFMLSTRQPPPEGEVSHEDCPCMDGTVFGPDVTEGDET